MIRSFRLSMRAFALVLALLLATVPFVLSASAAVPVPEAQYDPENPAALRDRDLEGTACLLMDRSTGRVLYSKNGDKRRYPASTTKIMTLLLALEYGNLNSIITIPNEANDIIWDSTRTPVFPGEEMPFIDLLYGMMMPSGNDAANAVAVIVSGSVDAFVKRMNERAVELGCKDTNFVNPHGYPDDNHYSTAMDLAIITREGMRHNTFRAISSTIEYTMSATSQREKKRLATKNPMLVTSSKFYYAPAMGVKSGFHSKAGQCFVGAAHQNDAYLISVTLHTSNDGRWTDTKRLMEYGFQQYEVFTFQELWASNPFFVAIENAATDDVGKGMLALDAVPGGSLETFTTTRLPDEYDEVVNEYKKNMQLVYSNPLEAPIRRGDIIGKLTMPGPEGKVLESVVVASRDVDAYVELSTAEQLFPWLDMTPIRMLLGLAALIVVLLVVVRMRITIRRNRRLKALYKMRLNAYERYRSMK